MYNKICIYCGKEFQSNSRNTRYCSKECLDKAQLKRQSVTKRRRVRRKEYDKNKEVCRLLSRAYKLAKSVAEELKLPKCNCEYCKGGSTDIELHHLNLNPLDNTPSNLIYLCKKKHAIVHSMQKSVNMVEVLSLALEKEQPYIYVTEYFKQLNIDPSLGFSGEEGNS